MELQTTDIRGHSIRYARAPRDGAPRLVLLPGWPQTLIGCDALWQALTAYFDLLAFELPGFGQADAEPAMMCPSAQAEFLAAALDHWAFADAYLLAPDVVVPIALTLAVRQLAPVRGLIVSNGPASYPPVASIELQALIRSGGVRQLAGWWPAALLGWTDWRGNRRQSLSRSATADRRSIYTSARLRRTMQYLASYPTELPALQRRLGSVRVPVLLLWGARDNFLPLRNAARLQAALPDAELRVLPDAGHFSHEDEPEAFTLEVVAWVARQAHRPEDAPLHATSRTGI